MKFMLMMHTPGKGAYQISSWPQQDIMAHISFMKDFARHDAVTLRLLFP